MLKLSRCPWHNGYRTTETNRSILHSSTWTFFRPTSEEKLSESIAICLISSTGGRVLAVGEREILRQELAHRFSLRRRCGDERSCRTWQHDQHWNVFVQERTSAPTMRRDDLDFKLTSLTIRWGAAQGAEWWRSRPAHNPHDRKRTWRSAQACGIKCRRRTETPAHSNGKHSHFQNVDVFGILPCSGHCCFPTSTTLGLRLFNWDARGVPIGLACLISRPLWSWRRRNCRISSLPSTTGACPAGTSSVIVRRNSAPLLHPRTVQLKVAQPSLDGPSQHLAMSWSAQKRMADAADLLRFLLGIPNRSAGFSMPLGKAQQFFFFLNAKWTAKISSGEPDFWRWANSTVAFLFVRKDVSAKTCPCNVFAMNEL